MFRKEYQFPEDFLSQNNMKFMYRSFHTAVNAERATHFFETRLSDTYFIAYVNVFKVVFFKWSFRVKKWD